MVCETKQKGDAGEAQVLAALVRAGLPVLVPWGDNAAYDLVVDLGGRFLRVQCKTGRPVGNGCIAFNTYRVGRTSVRTRYEAREFDYYGVWCRETGATYLVPFEDAASWCPYLRVEPPRPGSTGGRQKGRVRWAAKYIADLVIDGWRRTEGELAPEWTAPRLEASGAWHPLRRTEAANRAAL